MMVPIGAMAVCLFLWVALLTFDPGDWPSPHRYPHNSPTHNACGLVGSWVAYQSFHLIGDGVYPLVLFFSLAAILRLINGRIVHLGERLFGLALVVVCTSTCVHLLFTTASSPLYAGPGGLLGVEIGGLLNRNLSGIGSALVLVSSLIVGVIFAAQEWMLRVPRLLTRAASASSEAMAIARQLASSMPRLQPAAEIAGPSLASEPTRSAEVEKPRRSSKVQQEELEFEEEVEEEDEIESSVEESVEILTKTPEPLAGEKTPAPRSDEPAPSKRTVVQVSKPAAGPIVRFPTPQRMAASDPYPKQIENWRLPDLSLLQEPEFGFTSQQEGIVRKQAKVLEETLQEFRLDAQVVEIDTGPVITMFELRLGAGIKVSQIASLSNDIARALKAHAIRVVAPIPGKNTVGIEVPNLVKEKVRMKELMTLGGKKASEMALPLFLGKDAAGTALVLDLASMPHMLIAGTTGSGKSVCLNAIILSLLMTKRPDHVKMILIDPKMVEMSQYKEVPHLMCPLVTDMAKAEKILEWAVTQMDERYEWLSEARVRNIAGYNALGADELFERLKPATEAEKAMIPTFMPYIVIVIDELADLMMTAAKEVEHHLSRLAQKSRAVGVHIIVATQRPEVKVVTGLIKSNLPARVCFRVASRMDSRIVLDQNGGEVLMGQGDMLLLPPGSHKLLRAQGTYLEDAEIHAVLDDLATRAKPDFHPDLMKIKTVEADAGDDMRDPLFDDAVRIILESKRGSVSLLQRRLTIGYSRASRLIDQMAAAGIVGDYKGSQAREVVMTLEEWDAMRAAAAEDMNKGYEADQDLPFADSDEVMA